MTEDTATTSVQQASNDGLGYSRDVAKRLSVTARKLRLATSNRSSLFKSVGLRPRLIDRVFTAGVVVLTILILVVPNTISVFYYGYFASDQYQSETRFTVRSSTPALGKDQLAKVTGLPSSKIVQDTQIVTNYIGSGEMVSFLDKVIQFRRSYGDSSIDFWARLERDPTAEEMLDYWKGMVSTSVSASSGIVTVKARAFSADRAREVLEQVVAASEKVVNDVNARIWNDVISTAEINLKRAATQLQVTREQLSATRRKAGVLDVKGASTVINTLISSVQKEALELEQRYSSQLTTVSRDAPQMRVLQREISSKQAQIDDLKRQLAGAADDEGNLANVSREMSQVELEQELAEQQFAASVKTLEQVKFVSKQQLIYLDAFLAPTLPEEPEYPRRAFWIACVFIASSLLWAIALGVLFWGRGRLN